MWIFLILFFGSFGWVSLCSQLYAALCLEQDVLGKCNNVKTSIILEKQLCNKYLFNCIMYTDHSMYIIMLITSLVICFLVKTF